MEAGADRDYRAVERRSDFRTLAQMSFEELQQSVARDAAPPAGLSLALQALWHAANVRSPRAWERAHECAQDDPAETGAWVHAHLHRQEGDLENARYWYRRAGRTPPDPAMTLAAEWEQIARALLAR